MSNSHAYRSGLVFLVDSKLRERVEQLHGRGSTRTRYRCDLLSVFGELGEARPGP